MQPINSYNYVTIYYQSANRGNRKKFVQRQPQLQHWRDPMSERIGDRTTMILRAAGSCEIELDFLTKGYAAFKVLAREIEERLRPRLRTGQHILWILHYWLRDDEWWHECITYPSIGCEVFIVDKGGKRSQPFAMINSGRGPMILDDSFNPVFDHAQIAEEAAQLLLR